MIGLFGGTFDPIHFGHLRPALEVMEKLSLDEVRFIPANIPPHRGQPEHSTEARAEMVALAIQGQPGFVLDACELKRDTPSYTVDTLSLLRQSLGGSTPFVLLLGSDAFAGLPSWHQWERLLQLTHIAVMTRPGEYPRKAQFPPGYLERRLVDNASDLRQQPAGSILRVPVTQLDISATMIRELLQQERSVRYLLPQSVVDHIHTHHLYS
ncbi:MAG TPA: nicotinate-nucleotide adenylyltransferase [Gammaproteobacteria bacterium]|nr:nicotinate-nucleotide adenylyltransferase [Gammaproteobacteria bacterium]